MKKLTFLLPLFMSLPFLAHAQEELAIQKLRAQADSVLVLMEKETDPNKRFDHWISLGGFDSYPSLLIEYAEKLYKFSKKNNDQVIEALAWSTYGHGYRLSGNFVKGLECHHKAVALAEKSGNKSLVAQTQNQIAHIYKDRGEFEKAIRLYSAARKNAAQGTNEEIGIWPLLNLGQVYLATNQLDSSLYYSKQAYDLFLRTNITEYNPSLLSNIAGVYSKQGNEREAIKYFKMGEEASKKTFSGRQFYFLYRGMAEHFSRFKQQDSSIAYSKKALKAIRNTPLFYLSATPAKMLTDIYESTNSDSAIKYFKIFNAANDSLFNTKANQQLQMMTFEEEKRQQEIAAAKINYQNKIRLYLMIAGIAFILVIAFILYWSNKRKEKANRLLKKQKDEILSTLTQLKSTQALLIQSEKMASLGELTAGIAHEIQNPLNFVNNFSEVSAELIDEMNLEIGKGNMDEVKQIGEDLKQNLNKITHHGKRAGSIVSGMLQHSRTSTGQREATDINALADEYLRLAYHGLRAKEKTFNATFDSKFDETIGKINIVPQDMGRVILNLITNAFHAVMEKEKQDGRYQPTVFVSTKKVGDKILVSVKDNGNGVPQKIVDKIFQPFFTTKPTGQGTGLGLSLAYDIVKAHGGEIKVETKEGEGTEFIVSLPIG